MNSTNREKLRRNHRLLLSDLPTNDCMDYLYEKRVFTDEIMQEIKAEKTPRDKNSVLLESLKRTGDKGFETFYAFLEESCTALRKALDEVKVDADDTEVKVPPTDDPSMFNPSKDWELKVFFTKLAQDTGVTEKEMELVKNLVVGEIGCEEDILERLDSPIKFYRHLIRVELVNRYNLAFIQSLFYHIQRMDICKSIADFCRNNAEKAVHFFVKNHEPANGYTTIQFHLCGDPKLVKMKNIEDLVDRVARYLGVARKSVHVAAIQPASSLIVTLSLPKQFAVRLVDLMTGTDNKEWLKDIGVDYIVSQDSTIKITDDKGEDAIENYDYVTSLEKEIRELEEKEQHLKRCLYRCQVQVETLKDIQEELKADLQDKQKKADQLNDLASGLEMVLFAAISVIYTYSPPGGHLQQPYNPGVNSLKEHSAWTLLKWLRRTAKNRGYDSNLVEELLDTQALVTEYRFARQHAFISLRTQHFTNHLLYVVTQMHNELAWYRQLYGGLVLQQIVPPPSKVQVNLEVPIDINPDFARILRKLSSKLRSKEREKIIKKIAHLQEHRRHLTMDKDSFLERVLQVEIMRIGVMPNNAMVDKIFHDVFTAANRGDLKREFEDEKRKLAPKQSPYQTVQITHAAQPIPQGTTTQTPTTNQPNPDIQEIKASVASMEKNIARLLEKAEDRPFGVFPHIVPTNRMKMSYDEAPIPSISEWLGKLQQKL